MLHICCQIGEDVFLICVFVCKNMCLLSCSWALRATVVGVQKVLRNIFQTCHPVLNFWDNLYYNVDKAIECNS